MSKKNEIIIEPLARVEGHGGIKVEIEANKIRNVEFQILEGPRLFETLVVGRTPQEDLSIVPRICAICNLSHKYAALRGLEKALGVEIDPTTKLYRQLMHLGEIIESHSLHIYFLALPDFLGYDNAFLMADKYGDTVTNALKLKKFSNKIMQMIGGRMIHGENPIIGGFGKLPTKEQLTKIKEEALELLPFAIETINLLAGLEIPDHMERETQFLCCKPPHEDYDYYGDMFITSDGKEHPVENYNSIIKERVVSHSFAKRGQYRDKPFTVGALARILLLGNRLKGKAKEVYDKSINERWYRNPLFNNHAQAIEQVYSLERIPEIINEILTCAKSKVAMPTQKTGSGTGAVEAPRGTLIHHYKVKDGLISAADIITPTVMFLDDIEEFIRTSGNTLLAKNQIDKIELEFEKIARAYDPCISCSAHSVEVVYK
ncbi:MAG: Ni/Fe hydrogenase subunit alpha [Candidatus Lokiarchaeota archaeon]|nr:Ni/Fe hydrogenase subunit alpha [Candidatus Lokiarchaeota archaeon]